MPCPQRMIRWTLVVCKSGENTGEGQQKWDGSKFQFDFLLLKEATNWWIFPFWLICYLVLGSNHKLKLQTCGFDGGWENKTWKITLFFGRLGWEAVVVIPSKLPPGSISKYGCFLKWWYPQIIHFNRVFHYKPSILGYHYFWKHPYTVDPWMAAVDRFWRISKPQLIGQQASRDKDGWGPLTVNHGYLYGNFLGILGDYKP